MLDPDNTWYGDYGEGCDFARCYVKAQKRIKENWPDLPVISGGSIWRHSSLIWPPYHNPKNIYGSSGKFLRGFLAQTIASATEDGVSKFDYLPEAIAIHSYLGEWNPECFDWQDEYGYKVETEFKNRLKELYNICNEYGYLPIS